MKIYFYNFFHKGDVFCTRPFLETIISSLKNVDIQFFHQYDDYLLRGLNIEQKSLSEISNIVNYNSDNLVRDGILYINTWQGKYFTNDSYSGCNIKTLYLNVWSTIIKFINKNLNTELVLGNMEDYYPFFDQSFFNIDTIDKFIEEDSRKKVLFCNGPALSGQCPEYNGDMKEVIEYISSKYSNYLIITTHQIDSSLENIKYSGDIIQNDGQDLYEISYLSEFCDLIVGRSSGPFTFTNTKKNFFDSSKKFLCFGASDKVSWNYPYGFDDGESNMEAEYLYECFSTVESLKNSVAELLEL